MFDRFAVFHMLVGSLLLLPSMTFADDRQAIDFDRDIRPILSNNCFTCHGPDERNRKADLRLDIKDAALADLGGYRAIEPGHADKSELVRRIVSKQRSQQMPPPRSKKSLTPQQINLLKEWINAGAPWAEHWAFVKPHRPQLPEVKHQEWPKNGIDSFVLARMENEGIKPSPPASKEKWLRRVTLDLTGLPPTLAEVDAFLSDGSKNAREKVVDRLLASPRYGEHMALAWLDAARYADTNGYQQDRTRTMWPWRDWVIRAFNENMPFDQFTMEQIAGDLLPNATREQKLATGFHRNHMLNGEGGRNAEESRVEYVVDRVDTTATVWLGLTMGCCRCHSHKYDPITQKEFYRFYAYFNNIDEVGGVDRGGNAKPVMSLPTTDQEKKQSNLREQIAKLQNEVKNIQNKENKAKTQQELDAAKKALSKLEKSILEVMIMQDRANPRDTYLLKRGEWDQHDKSEKLFPDVPQILHDLPNNAPANRLALARWLVHPDNPLTARVTVNRYWQHFFGTGLVKTVEDFGSQGERPSHPRLLDWLATEFQRSGWNVKHMHKLIVLSATYGQTSKVTDELLKKDPYNRLLSRGPRFRLPSMVIRDQALAVSGLLVEKIGGPPVKPYQPPGIWFDLSLGKIRYQRDSGESLYRRSLYTFWRRSVGPTLFFDTPARQVCEVRQLRTNTPLHALTLMNDDTYMEASRVLADRIMTQKDNLSERLNLAFRMATCRLPSEQESRMLIQVYQKVLGRFQSDPESAKQLITVGEYRTNTNHNPVELAAYSSVCNMILNLDEVITKE